ncbi:MAG: hypothetical protein Q8L35_09300 [Actinomycetota bacterium]|nr:hypothetical protein [Actinomycetota bacterium]
MKKLIFIAALICLMVVAFNGTALAHSGAGRVHNASADPDAPDPNDPDCQVCHGAVEGNYVPKAPIHDGTATLNNTVEFNNLPTLVALKVEKDTTGHPSLDLGNIDPSKDATASFWTLVRSNQPYHETFSWTNFTDGFGGIIPSSRMEVRVTDNSIQSQVLNGLQHPVPSGTHPATNANWERIDVKVRTLWTDPVGYFTNTLSIVVTQP